MNKPTYIPLLRILCWIAIGFFLSVSSASAQQGFVIGNKGIPQDTLSPNDAEQIFLGRKTRWSDNQAIHFVVMKGGDVHEKFVKSFLSKTPSQFQAFWKMRIFTGQGRAPLSFDKPEDILDYVSSTPGAIGYIPASLPRENVKVVATLPAN
jgi:ABC-type phosphate transport system substrate-binding protein